MQRRAIISTHHKTGTVWMEATFRGVCKALDIPLIPFRRGEASVAAAPPPAVFLDAHSAWFGHAASAWRQPEDRVLHVIRDPRDVIISAMHYHRTAEEKWLHMPNEDFGGMTYQAKINSLADDHARYLFEIGNNAGKVIAVMARWNYARPECFECKYEDLIVDTKTDLFTRGVAHLGFAGPEVKICRRWFRRHALFGGASGKRKPHVRSGAPRQWPGVFDRELGEAFADTFGDVLVRLGYEPDQSWIAALAPRRISMKSASTA